MISKTFRIGGIHPSDNKITADKPTVALPAPDTVVIPLAQHIGAPAVPIVKKGDKVKVGSLIAQANGFVSAPIHSSVSGTVLKIDKAINTSGYYQPAIIIGVEDDVWEDSIDRTDTIETLDEHPEITSETIVQRVKDAGIVGMGGAGFPTFIKLCPSPENKLTCVIINAVECEPYITSDYRLIIEHADEILIGIKLLMKATSVSKAYIGVEDNKPEAISLLMKKTRECPEIEVVSLKQKYPQGGEKQLVDAIIRRQVPAPPAIPASVGALVQNVATTYAIYEAVMKNKPLIERCVTVTGKKLSQPGNFLVRIGTPVKSIIDHCGGLPEGKNKLLSGGPMMGKALMSDEVPVCKNMNCITVISGKETTRSNIGPCIRCAKCVNVCPMGLEPYLIATVSAMHDWEKAEKNNITSCLECGACQYTCPANRPMLDNIRLGKYTVSQIIKSRTKK
ncbi:MAG: electron transport complex subunit RsxC [Prevotella sp.]